MPAIPSDDYLTPSEAARILRRSARTLARMRAEGRGPRYHREGGLVLYLLSDLKDWLLQFTVTPPRSCA